MKFVFNTNKFVCIVTFVVVSALTSDDSVPEIIVTPAFNDGPLRGSVARDFLIDSDTS